MGMRQVGSTAMGPWHRATPGQRWTSALALLLAVCVLAFGLPEGGPFTIGPIGDQIARPPSEPTTIAADEPVEVSPPPPALVPAASPPAVPLSDPAPPAPSPTGPEPSPEVLPPEDADEDQGLALPGLPPIPAQTLPDPLRAAGEEAGDLLVTACGSSLTYLALLRLLSGGVPVPPEFVPVVQAILDYPPQLSVACGVLTAAGTATDCEIDTSRFPEVFDTLNIDAPVPPPAGFVGQTMDVAEALEEVLAEQLGVDPTLTRALAEGFGCETTDVDA